MKILRHRDTLQFAPYPRDDDEPVVGLTAEWETWDLIEVPRPDPQPGFAVEPEQAIDEQAKTLTRGWAQVELPPEPPADPDYEGFYLALKGTRLYGSLIAPLVFDNVSVAIKGAFTVVIAALIDMRMGSSLVGPGQADPSLQAALTNFMAIATPALDQDAVDELQGLMDQFGLAPLYNLGNVAP